MYIKSYSFRLFSSLPGVLTPVRGESLKILNGFDVSLPVSHSLWSNQSFGHQKGDTPSRDEGTYPRLETYNHAWKRNSQDLCAVCDAYKGLKDVEQRLGPLCAHMLHALSTRYAYSGLEAIHDVKRKTKVELTVAAHEEEELQDCRHYDRCS
ncbi:hypothetical protein Tco_0410479 [Tanacetum coccineum]